MLYILRKWGYSVTRRFCDHPCSQKFSATDRNPNLRSRQSRRSPLLRSLFHTLTFTAHAKNFSPSKIFRYALVSLVKNLSLTIFRPLEKVRAGRQASNSSHICPIPPPAARSLMLHPCSQVPLRASLSAPTAAPRRRMSLAWPQVR